MMKMAGKDEVEKFLATTKFSGYQSVPLPYGLAVPGRDRSPTADHVLGDRVKGKSILDVGAYYGYFTYEAKRRGATLATGIEANRERYEIAKQIAGLHGNIYNILQGRIEDIECNDKYDIVLFMNVLHHIIDPIQVVHKLRSLCRETLIIEFCLVDDPAYLIFICAGSNPPRFRDSIKAHLRAFILRYCTKGLPMIAVGNREYDYAFYFTREAFYNLFVIHHKLFKSIEFLPSRTNAPRVVAICQVA